MLLGVVVDDDRLTLEMDFCLQPGHPAYEPPGAGEEFCLHPGTIRFASIAALDLARASHVEPAQRRHAIQSFAIDGNRFAMRCDWGTINLQARSIRVATE